jgi:predicted HTH transcriptional regulator
LREENVNKKLEYVVAKTISAFLNSEGGTLIIGVDDDGNILGLEKDFQTLSKQNTDEFELHLRQVIKKYLGENFEKYLKISFPKIDDKEICVIKILKSGKPVFLTFESNESFFVRIGNASIPKNRQEQSEYEKIHFNL